MVYKKRRAKRKTTRKTGRGSIRKTPLTAAQKRLKTRQVAPWLRIKAHHMYDPIPYIIPWEERHLTREIDAKKIDGLCAVAEGSWQGVEDYRAHVYSWEDYCTRRAHTIHPETPFPQGRKAQDYTLRDDQKEDVLTVIKQFQHGAPEFLIANGTGTGKTVTAWKITQVLRPTSVLIVCPSAVIPSWRQHIMDMGDKGMDIVIINYESLKKLVSPPDSAVNKKKPATQNKYWALEGEPYTYFDMVIFDEAHKLKNPTSQQSRIADTFASHATYVLRLTATPGKDPSQLHHIWRGLSWRTGVPVTVDTRKDNDFSSYVTWCKKQGIGGIVPAAFGNGISWKGEEKDLTTMRNIMYRPSKEGRLIGIKRKPETWENVVRLPLPIELSPEDKKAYSIVVEDTKNEILKGVSKNREDVTRGLAAMVKMRQKTGILKAPHIVEYIAYCLGDLDEQVVVSAIYKKTVETISELLDRKKIPHVIVTGENTPEEKERNRVMFQQGKIPVIITSITTGISLHAEEKATQATSNNRRMIIADTHWSPIEHTQLEGRINRDGKNGVITIPFLGDTIDEKVTNTLLKGLTSQSILQGEGEENDLMMLANCFGININYS